jgi:hypothetical protein
MAPLLTNLGDLMMNYVETCQAISTSGARGDHRRANRIAVTAIGIIALLLAGTAGDAAIAQSSRAPISERQSSELRYQAPIGARQPRPQDLPANVVREEGRATASQRTFDKKLEICRDCGISK